MCTAITYQTNDMYFGRTLDYDISYDERILIVPRRFPLSFRHVPVNTAHYSMIGMGIIAENYPLYFDATNEKGLAMASLNFVGYAAYKNCQAGKTNIAHFELIPWILSQCADISEAEMLLHNCNITDDAFSPAYPIASLHWLIADQKRSITVEATKDGLRVFDNPIGVLTNNPPFEVQLLNLSNFMGLSPQDPINRAFMELEPKVYSRGMGAIGLPGDLSSQSRFIRAAFMKSNSVCNGTEAESVAQFFHILDSVGQIKGCCEVADGRYEITQYSSCCNTAKGIYYYTTYQNRQINAVAMNADNLIGRELVEYSLCRNEKIHYQNETGL